MAPRAARAEDGPVGAKTSTRAPTLFGLELRLETAQVVMVGSEALVAFPPEVAENILELAEKRGPAAERVLHNQAELIVLQDRMIATATRAWERLERQAEDQAEITERYRTLIKAGDAPFYETVTWWVGVVVGAALAGAAAGVLIAVDD